MTSRKIVISARPCVWNRMSVLGGGNGRIAWRFVLDPFMPTHKRNLERKVEDVLISLMEAGK